MLSLTVYSCIFSMNHNHWDGSWILMCSSPTSANDAGAYDDCVASIP